MAEHNLVLVMVFNHALNRLKILGEGGERTVRGPKVSKGMAPTKEILNVG